MRSNNPENLSPDALEIAEICRQLPPEAQRELLALAECASRHADIGAVDAILEQRRRGDITGLEATELFERLPGRADA